MKKKPPKFPGDRGFVYLDEEERELIESIENGEWKDLPKREVKKELALARRAARNTLAKNARVNIRMNQNDLRGLKAKAAGEGLPYQTLLSCLVHKYVSGQIKFTIS
jgi:predicted DNA binding CopG/RHH family protein